MNRIRSAVSAGAALALGAGTLLLAAPAASAAEAYDMPQPTLSYTAASQGNATSSTGAYVWLGSNTSLQVTIGSVVAGQEGAITIGTGNVAGNRTLTWYSCSSRGAALASCRNVRSLTAAGIASNTSYTYQPTAEDAGRYLAYEVAQSFTTAAGSTNTARATSDRAKDLQVISQLGNSARPAWGINGVQAGGKASLLVFPWTLPSGSTFTSRTVTVSACPNANQGQEATAAWSNAGCTAVPGASITGGTVNANSASAFQVQTTADMAGKTLVAEVLLLSKTANGTATIFTIRSAGATLPAAAAGATPSPSPTATDEAAASLIPSGSPSAGTAAASSAVVPKVKIVAVKTIVRGRSTGVAIELTGRGKGTVGSGTAIVEVVKTGAPGEKASQKLKTTTIKGMKGFQKQTLSKKLKKGTYYLRVIYTDGRSKVQAGALKKISVK